MHPYSLGMHRRTFRQSQCQHGGTFRNRTAMRQPDFRFKTDILRRMPRHRVIASTSLGPHPIQMFSIMDDSLHFEGAFLNKGRGPNELVSPSYYADSSGLYIADNLSASGRLYEYSYAEDKGLTMKAVSDLSGFRPYFFSDKFIRTGNGKFIVAGGRTNNNEIISFIDLDRNESIPLDFWPEGKTDMKGLPPSSKSPIAAIPALPSTARSSCTAAITGATLTL